MTGLDWIPLYEAFGKFKARAKQYGLFPEELERMEDALFRLCPFPQPQRAVDDTENAGKQP